MSLTAADVLRRYMAEQLPEFIEVVLHDVNQVGNFGNAPLKVAAVRGALDELQALLDGGASIDARGEHGYTALHHAAEQGHVAAVRLLLKYRADTHVLNDFGKTPCEAASASQLNAGVRRMLGRVR